MEKGLMTREKLDAVLKPELLTQPQPLPWRTTNSKGKVG